MNISKKLISLSIIGVSLLYPLITYLAFSNHFTSNSSILLNVFLPVLLGLGIISYLSFDWGISYSRIFVGSIFIVSGLIKANDTLGFSYKLEEYFAENALGWTYFEPYALWIAILVCCGEVILGLATLFGAKMKLVSWLLMFMMLFFLGLTYYTAQCDPTATFINANGIETPVACVTDCGCFGDAMKGSVGRSLTPWESFYKDFLLILAFLPTLLFQRKIKLNTQKQDSTLLPISLFVIAFVGGWIFDWWFPLIFSFIAFLTYYGVKKLYKFKFMDVQWKIAFTIAFLSFSFAFYTLWYLPIKDYRPYAVGKNINEGLKSAEELGLKAPVYATNYLLKNKSTGEEKVFLSSEYTENKLWETWDFIEAQGEPRLIEEGYEPPIPPDFDFGYDVNEDLKSSSTPVIFVCAYDILHTNMESFKKIQELFIIAQKNNYKFYCVSASYEAYDFQQKNNLPFEIISGDEKIIKTIVRSNPGVLLIQNGNIIEKWGQYSIPSEEKIKKLIK